ncbi:MAG TPA: DUF308 domain-containing protein [Candidatus Binatia bacterium]|nr:DUF308 domain-containing protein [Candidatus Binatia bacterium]
MRTIADDVAGSIQQAHKTWGWYLALGILLILVGVYAIMNDVAASVVSVVVLGVLLIVAGIAQLFGTFMVRGAGHVILLLLVGALDVIVGWMLIQHPELGALFLTVLLAVLFVFGGIYRFVAALWLQFPHYGWVALSGLVTLALGVILWTSWPISGLWFIGIAVGINFIFAGVAWSAMAWKLRTI